MFISNVNVMDIILTFAKVAKSTQDLPLSVETYTVPSSRPMVCPKSVKNTQF